MPTRALKADRLLKNARIIILAGFLLVLIAALARADRARPLPRRRPDGRCTHWRCSNRAQSLLIASRDAETNKRSFLLTATPRIYGGLRQRHDRRSPKELDRLRALTTDNPEQQARVAELGKLIDAKLDELKRTHALIQQGKPEEALAILNTPGSRQLINDIRDDIAGVIQPRASCLPSARPRPAKMRYLLAFLIGLALISAALLSGLLAISTLQCLAED